MGNPEPQPGKYGGNKTRPGQGSDPFLCEEMEGARRISVGGCVRGRHPLPSSGQGSHFPAFLWRFSWEEASPTCPSASLGWSGCPPVCLALWIWKLTVLSEGGWPHRARALQSMQLTFLPREGRAREEGSVAETTRHLLYCSRTESNGRPSMDLFVLHLSLGSTSEGSCHPRPRRN